MRLAAFKNVIKSSVATLYNAGESDVAATGIIDDGLGTMDEAAR
jgi:hypothetical protein